MLPFLKNKANNSGGVIVQNRPQDSAKNDIQPDSMEACVDRLLRAFATKDKVLIAQAIRDIHDELHLEMDEKSNSYDKQNMLVENNKE